MVRVLVSYSLKFSQFVAFGDEDRRNMISPCGSLLTILMNTNGQHFRQKRSKNVGRDKALAASESLSNNLSLLSSRLFIVLRNLTKLDIHFASSLFLTFLPTYRKTKRRRRNGGQVLGELTKKNTNVHIKITLTLTLNAKSINNPTLNPTKV